MQRAVNARTRHGRFGRMLSWFDNDFRIGAAVTGFVVMVLVATAVLYLHPPGRTKVSFEATDVSAISVGQDVRVAGISVGSVSDMTIGTDTVRVTMDIDKNIVIGPDSRVDVRMLTPVGGYAITIVPVGDVSVGDEPLPVGQVTVPYSIGDVLQAAPTVTDHVDAGTIDADLTQVAQALQSNPDSVGSVISGMSSIAQVMDQQREQVRTITALASEYLNKFDANRDMVFEVIRKMDVVLSTYNTNHAGFNEAYRLLGYVLMTVAPYAEYYLAHGEDLAGGIERVRSTIEEFNATMGPSIDALSAARDKLANWLTPQGLATIGGETLMASDICMPVPGRSCS
ncbi:MlaD family protein [Aldersonia kunmingensis]|uniref:MlaD family protein n=1 Tax=Aldersonia kunmingensis TaxID=408066 RepID=UPI0009FBF389|nr:MlaD family protein [Aldersonia kunmingensis]